MTDKKNTLVFCLDCFYFFRGKCIKQKVVNTINTPLMSKKVYDFCVPEVDNKDNSCEKYLNKRLVSPPQVVFFYLGYFGFVISNKLKKRKIDLQQKKEKSVPKWDE